MPWGSPSSLWRGSKVYTWQPVPTWHLCELSWRWTMPAKYEWRQAFPTKLCPNCKLVSKTNYCFQKLNLELVTYAAIYSWNSCHEKERSVLVCWFGLVWVGVFCSEHPFFSYFLCLILDVMSGAPSVTVDLEENWKMETRHKGWRSKNLRMKTKAQGKKSGGGCFPDECETINSILDCFPPDFLYMKEKINFYLI